MEHDDDLMKLDWLQRLNNHPVNNLIISNAHTNKVHRLKVKKRSQRKILPAVLNKFIHKVVGETHPKHANASLRPKQIKTHRSASVFKNYVITSI